MDRYLYIFIVLVFYTFFIKAGYSVILRRTERDDHWSYTGEHGPLHWGGVCNVGMRQSPVNIELDNVKERSFEPLHFGDNYNRKIDLEPSNPGHNLMVTCPKPSPIISFHGGGLDGKYIFEQLHFHWDAEHLIDGERAAMEMHLVHYNSKYKDFGSAKLKSDGVCVLAVLCDESEAPDSELEHFTEDALYIMAEREGLDLKINSKKNKVHSLRYKLRHFLPRNVRQWFRYDGSLTTPGCDETITWIILKERMRISRNILSSLRELRDLNQTKITMNYRPIQNLNGRTIFLQADNSVNEIVTDDKNSSGPSKTNYVFLYLISISCIIFSTSL